MSSSLRGGRFGNNRSGQRHGRRRDYNGSRSDEDSPGESPLVGSEPALPRFFRLYEKKRGNRRTGSQAFGSFGEALFFGTFLAVGCAALAFLLVVRVWPEWRANRQFVATTCIVLEKRVGDRPATENEPAMYRPELRIRYQVDDQEITQDDVSDVTQLYSPDKAAAQAVVDEFEVGKEYPCWYDPLDPHRAVVLRGYSGWLYVSLLIPISFIVIGAGRLTYTLLHWNASAERLAAGGQRLAQNDRFETPSGDREFPSVPEDANQTNSPGTTLAYRLPIATNSGWTLFAAAAACLSWNAIVTAFVIMVASSFARGEPDWTLALLVIPFLAGGIWLAVFLARQIFRMTGMGPTRIEISAHPLEPGRPYEVFLSQAGRLAMKSLEVWLVCDEKATYHQGTDTRTETRRVFQRRSFVRDNFEIQGLPFESRCQFQIPPGAMHSFQAPHNEVNWKLIVKGSVVGWPDYERVFPIVVNPSTARTQLPAHSHSHA